MYEDKRTHEIDIISKYVLQCSNVTWTHNNLNIYEVHHAMAIISITNTCYILSNKSHQMFSDDIIVAQSCKVPPRWLPTLPCVPFFFFLAAQPPPTHHHPPPTHPHTDIHLCRTLHLLSWAPSLLAAGGQSSSLQQQQQQHVYFTVMTTYCGHFYFLNEGHSQYIYVLM